MVVGLPCCFASYFTHLLFDVLHFTCPLHNCLNGGSTLGDVVYAAVPAFNVPCFARTIIQTLKVRG